MKRLPDTAIKDLVEGGLLRSCDILLMHTRRSPRAWLIQHGTHTYWNHALMVHIVKDANTGHDRTLIIDPKMSGLKIDEVSYYLNNPDRYDVGVKRFEHKWFHEASDAAGLCCRDRVLDLALRKVRENQGSVAWWRPVLRFLRHIKLAFHLKQPAAAPGQASEKSSPRKQLDVTAYTCSGFIQWCFYHSVCDVSAEDANYKHRVEDVVFNPRLSTATDDYSLLSTTPGDLARSDKLSWKYVVRNGMVWEVGSGEEANRICK